ncbi:hypothetical protein AYO21_02879 [Fonsecaea monophora]|uniref:Protein kinase domain-containing protein n=1 Tax=Fonsecaea monophora TaxID=254056 RepID=A0A177FFF9_9EURO|nr:hypothetical protein AYO21_02879 [Fonsecaea monophora]OAG42928.1 hypothetical protein AYO21_02879 [Fonsecaea monophora]
MNTRARASVPSDLLKEFQANLRACWKQETFCGRYYIKTSQLQEWMASVGEGQKATNLKRLLTEVWRSRHDATFPPTAEKVSRAVIVFSVLLDIGYGHLVDLFCRAEITDARLSAEHNYKHLKRHLGNANVPEPDAVVDAFEERRWFFCPVLLKRHMQGDFGRGCVFPYYKRQPVNGKGGTAEVFQVLVPAECIAEDLKQFLRASMVEYKDKGKFYEMALKSYGSENQAMFDWERNAFAGLEDQKGMVRYIGHYSYEEPPAGLTHNILLEFGELDLDEFFAHEFSSPPVRSPEIISFWESLFQVAEALQRIHNLKIDQDGQTEEYYGWHADVKPDNILRVHGEFKLVDFGFTKFKKKGSQAIPMEYMDGGTQSYGTVDSSNKAGESSGSNSSIIGAPETDQSRSKTRTPHGQTIDTWSFGCVLSRAATWVILGQQGILQYDFVRKAAIKRLRKPSKTDKTASSRCPTADDAFHNGRKVLPEVLQWHDYLRSIVRTSDTISCLVLDLVEHHMLLESPEDRVSSKGLCMKLDDIVLLANAKADRDECSKLVANTLLADLYNFDQEAPANADQADRSKDAKSIKTSGRIGKSQRLDNIPPAKTAHRAEMLTEKLQILGEESPPPRQATPQPHLRSGSSYLDGLQVHESPRGYTDSDDDVSLLIPQLSPSSKSDGAAVKPERGSRRYSELELMSRHISSQALEDPDGASVSPAEKVRDDVHGKGLGDQQRRFSKAPSYTTEKQPDVAAEEPPSSSRRDSKLETTQSLELSSSSISFDDLFAAPPKSTRKHDNYDIYRVKADLEQTRHFLTGKVKVDKSLKDKIVNRDIKFIIDNGSSMLHFWPEATDVLETLAMKLAPLDDDGLDMVFTSGPLRPYNKGGKKAASKFAGLMKEKTPAMPPDPTLEVKTDMTETLGVVFDEYLQSYKNKRMTLLVLTDGLWRGTKAENPVEVKIAKFLKKVLDGNHMEDRRFSISFIRFGDYPEAVTRLSWLDDDFPKVYRVPDMIDHVPWTGPVNKMILGSFDANQDDKNNDS